MCEWVHVFVFLQGTEQKWWDKRIALSVVKYWHGKYCARRTYVIPKLLLFVSMHFSLHHWQMQADRHIRAGSWCSYVFLFVHVIWLVQLHFLCAIPALHAHFTCFFFHNNLHSHNWKRADVILESNFYLFHFVRFCIRAIWKILPSPAHRQVAFIFRDTLMYYSVCVCKFFVAVIAAVAIAIPPEEN